MHPRIVLAALVAVAALGSAARIAGAVDEPAPAPAPSPTPSATPHDYVRFVEAGLLPGERTRTTLGFDRTGPITNRARGALEYRFFGESFIEIDYRRWKPSFTDQDVYVNSSIFGRTHLYLATSTFIHSSSSGTPNLHGDLGFGIEALPNVRRAAGLYLSYYYFPEVTGRIAATGGDLRYKLESYSAGGTLAVPRSPLFLSAGVAGDHYLRKQNAPAEITHRAVTAGIGVRF